MAQPAAAHVKWFAPFIVSAAPRSPFDTVENRWFWVGLALVMVFFLSARVIEASPAGPMIHRVLDRATGFLWLRADDFMRVAAGTFFVAIFAVGGVYLTPDLKTKAEWISWMQFLIAVGIFWRATMPLSALGIVALWVIALRDYPLFHLLDYLALGLGLAGYLALFATADPAWRALRYRVLITGVSIALMWSSLEKFAYPEWFSPLVVEKPYLTFGLSEDRFIPMAGVAEFTMGFGLLWTPLIRRLSAIALLVIFMSAVWPFGRVDMLGHAIIMSAILLAAVMPAATDQSLGQLWRGLAAVPLLLVLALAGFSTAYWGAHWTLYRGAASSPDATAVKTTHSPSEEYPSDGVAPVTPGHDHANPEGSGP